MFQICQNDNCGFMLACSATLCFIWLPRSMAARLAAAGMVSAPALHNEM
jgi:hypothetical protein